MQVTEEDGGRLNAFAREPRMELIEEGASTSRATRVVLIGGGLLVALLMAVAAGISQIGKPRLNSSHR